MAGMTENHGYTRTDKTHGMTKLNLAS